MSDVAFLLSHSLTLMKGRTVVSEKLVALTAQLHLLKQRAVSFEAFRIFFIFSLHCNVIVSFYKIPFHRES